MLAALEDARIVCRYSELIKIIYKRATVCVSLHWKTTNFKVAGGVRQDTEMYTISPKLFTTLLENLRLQRLN